MTKTNRIRIQAIDHRNWDENQKHLAQHVINYVVTYFMAGSVDRFNQIYEIKLGILHDVRKNRD